MKAEHLVYFCPMGSKHNSWSTGIANRCRKSSNNKSGVVIQSINDFIGVYVGSESTAPITVEDFNKASENENYLVLGIAGDGKSFDIRNEVTTDLE